MKRVKMIGATIVAVAAAGSVTVGAAAVPAGATGTASGPTVPDAIRVPDGNKQLAAFGATGVQIYGCGSGVWTLLEPAAALTSRGVPVAIHSKGPIWTSTVDGSSVGATSVGSSPQPDSIPQLLLKANSNAGAGVFGSVTYVQRLNTRGGVAPSGSCTDGTRTAVRYSAEYAFWGAA